jgi:hypothetical protein
MSDEPSKHEREDGHEPQGVVETIREEIEDVVEEVVEHVPQPVRWTVGKLARLVTLVFLGLAVLALISAVLFFMNRTELVARELSILLNRTLREHSDLVLDLRDIRGNPFTGFRAIEPRVRFRDGATLIAAREMKVDYSALSLAFGKSGQIELTLERPDVHLVGKNGEWRLPVWRSNPSRKGSHATTRELQIRLRVHNASVLAPAPYGRASDVSLDAIANLGQTSRVRLDHMTWGYGPWGSKLDGLTADLSADSTGIHARLSDLRTADLEMNAKADWRAGDADRDVHVVVGRVRWRWLATVFDNRSFDVPGEGAFVLDARGSREWNGHFESTLDWDGLTAEGTGRAHWRAGELLLDSLAATSNAGNLLGTLRWSKTGWEVGGDARHADPSHWHALHLDEWPAGDLNGRFHYTVDTRGKPIGVLEASLIPSEWQGWRADSALVRVDFPPVAPDSFRVLGVRAGGHFQLRGRSDANGWSGPYSIRELPLDEWPDGKASGLSGVLERGDGTVESRPGGLYVTGDLAGGATNWASATFSQWTLAGVRGRLLPTPDLTAQAGASDGTFLGIHLDKASAPIALGDQVVRFAPISAQAGDTTVTLTGQAAWHDNGWWMTVTSAEMASSQFHFTAEPPVRISGDASGVLFEHVAANDHDAHVEARGRWASPGGPYDFEFTGHRLDLAHVGLAPELGLAGQADVRLSVQGRSGDPRWRFEGRAGRPAFGGHTADSLSLVLSGGANRLQLEDGRYELSGGTLRAAGAVEHTVAPFPDSLSATALVRWLTDAGSWRGEVTSEALPVAPFIARGAGGASWTGLASGRLTLSGSPSHPIADVDAEADGFGWHDIKAERVELTGHYADGWFVVPKLTARRQNVQSTGSIRLPLQLALGAEPKIPELPIQGQVDIPAGDLQVLPLVVPQLQSAHGRFKLDAQLSGTPRAIQLSGTGQIRDGSVRAINRSEVFSNLNADLHFDEKQITLDTLYASQGRTGRATADGRVQLKNGKLETYKFNVSLRDVAAAEEGLYAVLFDGDFVVSDGPRVAGEVLPEVDGQAVVKRGVVEFDFANQSDVEKRASTTEPLYWTYRLQVEATNNLRWHTEGAVASADIEFDADLDLQQTADSLLIYGEMKSLRGTYYYLSNRFKIDGATLTFDNQQGVDPLLDVTAETTVPGSDPKANSPETITARITGRSSQPLIALTSSDATADQKSILGALTVRGFRADGSQGISTDPLDNYFTQKLNAQLSSGLSDFFAGAITDWELQREHGGLLTGDGALVVGMGSQVTNKLALRYQQRVPGTGGPTTTVTSGPATQTNYSDLLEQNVEAEFRVNRFIYLTSGVSRRRVSSNALVPTTDYNVNLKARWEY